jgi:hypothetical protein
MGLRDATIDILHEPPPFETIPCKLIMAIIDATNLDDATRYELLIKKLTGYMAYIADPTFPEKHPGITPADVIIRILSSSPPTSAMRLINAIKSHDEKIRVRVVFEDYMAYMSKLRGGPDAAARN